MKPAHANGYAEAVSYALGQVQTGRPAKQPTGRKRLLTDIEAADYIGASKSYVRALVTNGVIKRADLPAADGSGKSARLWRIDRADLDAWIEKLKA